MKGRWVALALAATAAWSGLVGVRAGRRDHGDAGPTVLAAQRRAEVLSDLLDAAYDDLAKCELDRGARIVFPGDTALKQL